MRDWRNQPTNRDASVYTHVISEEEHAAWWARTQDDPSRRVLIFEAEGRPIGVVNFFDLDLDGDTATGGWGFYLDHDTTTAEGTALLLWTRVMSEAIDYAFDELGLDELHGEVLAHNEAVRVMNRRYRFVEGEAEERFADGRNIEVIPIMLRRTDRRRRR